jgi:hypothetical protein
MCSTYNNIMKNTGINFIAKTLFGAVKQIKKKSLKK